jgi:MOSC domain-containing protein YiiM
MQDPCYIAAEVLDTGMDHIRQSPKTSGVVELIVRRPDYGQRETPREARLDQTVGLVGDNWLARGCRKMPDQRPNPDAQLTLMNARAIALIAGALDRWALAGDQLYVDLDLSTTNLPAGTRLQIGEALIEITAEPHTGCGKFKARYGPAAVAFVNSPEGRELCLRGVNARIITGGVIRVADSVQKL